METKNLMKITLFIFIFLGICEKISSQDFSYEGSMGPEHWRQYYNTCDGKYQSPINIDIHKVRKVAFPPLQMIGFNVTPVIAYIKNNGHTVQVTMDFLKLPTISGGPLNGTYKFAQFHYHWGDNDTYGSEDMINDQSFPIELHIVFYKTTYNKFENALNFPDGVVVLAYFYEIADNTNHFYDELSLLLNHITYPGNETKFLNGPMIRDLTTNDTEHYFTYTGSLTTPPCSEVVTWIDFKAPIPISSEQISRFRHLHDNEGKQLTHNYRPIQPLNGRIIYENDPSSTKTHTTVNTRIDHDDRINIIHEENYNKINYIEKESSTANDLIENNNINKILSEEEIINDNNNNKNNNEHDYDVIDYEIHKKKVLNNKNGNNSASNILSSPHLILVIFLITIKFT